MKLSVLKKLLYLTAILTALFILAGCAQLSDFISGALETMQIDSELSGGVADSVSSVQPDAISVDESDRQLDEHGVYTSVDDVALYIHTYGHLPDNYISKAEAKKQGWEGGSLEEYFPGCSIGGDRFGNYEGLLPSAPGRSYTECDIDTLGASSRGAKRIVFSNDGLIYYTDDHYESFTMLYGGN